MHHNKEFHPSPPEMQKRKIYAETETTYPQSRQSNAKLFRAIPISGILAGIMMCVAINAGSLVLYSSSSSSTASCSWGKHYSSTDSVIGLQSYHDRRRHPTVGSIRCVSSSSSSSAPATPALEEENILSLEVSEVKARSRSWLWRGHNINYLIYPGLGGDDITSPRPPLLLVHGFGASVAHWRRNIPILSRSYTVYAVDLLGFGASDKPRGFAYSMEAWSQLILDFLNEIIQRPTVLIGNSVGSLACLIAAADSSWSLIRGLVLLNCAGGMNNKAIVDDWRIKLLLPLLWFFDFLLNQRGIASFLFDKVKQRGNIRNILMSIYGNKESVDEELVEIIRGPADDEGALDAFVSIVTGPPGPNPVQLIPKIISPVLLLWGDQDPFTPLDGPVGKYFSSLPTQLPNITLFVLDGVGHCPHDDRPDLVHARLLPWLANLPASNDVVITSPKSN